MKRSSKTLSLHKDPRFKGLLERTYHPVEEEFMSRLEKGTESVRKLLYDVKRTEPVFHIIHREGRTLGARPRQIIERDRIIQEITLRKIVHKLSIDRIGTEPTFDLPFPLKRTAESEHRIKNLHLSAHLK